MQKLHFDEDKGKKVVFDQPYYYYAPPEGGEYDQNSYYRFKDGSFLTDEGYFFNNLGYDRYGGYLDKNFNYAIKDEKDITAEEKKQLKQYPFWDPNTGQDDNQFGGQEYDEEKFQNYDDKQYREDQRHFNQYDEEQEGDGGDDIFFKRQPRNVKYQLKGAKKQQRPVAAGKQNNKPQQNKNKPNYSQKFDQTKNPLAKSKLLKNEKKMNDDDDWDFD